jgi:tetratricopeptide (TPR) repeat protein
MQGGIQIAKIKLVRYCIVLLLCYSLPTTCQNHKADSLLRVLKTEKEDTNKVKTIHKLFWILRNNGQYSRADSLAMVALSLSKNLDFKRGLAIAYNDMGVILENEDNYANALDCYEKALELNRSLKNKKGELNALGNIGVVYDDKGDYPKALDYAFKTLAICEGLGDKELKASVLNNIGTIYDEEGDYQKALDYFFKEVDICTEIIDSSQLATAFTNIGLAYEKSGKYELALNYCFKAANLQEKVENAHGIATAYTSIGICYKKTGDYVRALEYEEKALKIREEMGDKGGVASSCNDIGETYMEQKKYQDAISCENKTLEISERLGILEGVEYAEMSLSEIYGKMGYWLQSVTHYKRYITARDSLFNRQNTKKIVQTEMQYGFDKRQAEEKAAQDKKDALAEQENKKQRIIRNSLIAGFGLLLALVFFIFRGYKQKQKANQIISKEKAKVEEKQKEILDSITYAKRLQSAILPPIGLVKQFFPESFILYKPKDIVAGDFYWMQRVAKLDGKGDIVLIAAADCTGHGVPGAMVSVVCSNALNRIVKETEVRDTGSVLDNVRDIVLETFGKSEGNVQDGMDISLCAINLQANILEWTGANNPLWYIHKNKFIEIEPDKQPVGKQDNAKPFTTHLVNIEKGDTIYLFTDGYADQFGGPKGKKFKYKQLQEKLLALSGLPLEEQKTELEKTFDNWKGTLEQVDDVLIMGIRI